MPSHCTLQWVADLAVQAEVAEQVAARRLATAPDLIDPPGPTAGNKTQRQLAPIDEAAAAALPELPGYLETGLAGGRRRPFPRRLPGRSFAAAIRAWQAARWQPNGQATGRSASGAGFPDAAPVGRGRSSPVPRLFPNRRLGHRHHQVMVVPAPA